MLDVEFFSRLGLFVDPGFLTGQSCRTMCAELRGAAADDARTGADGGRFVVDRARRRARCARVCAATDAAMGARLRALVPRLEQHFGLALRLIEAPQFLIYGTGDLYTAHRDVCRDPAAPPHVRDRVVSVVVFLNDARQNGTSGDPAHPGGVTHEGGELVFHELGGDVGFACWGLPLAARAGVLVAFPSRLEHEVLPVRSGHRYTIAVWFAG